jgi:hypothetical protein
VVSQSSGLMSTTATRAAPLLGAVCTITPARRGRLLVHFPWALVFSDRWPAVAADWRRTFVTCPGPRLAYYRPTAGVWSVRASAREQLERWAEANGLEVSER